MTGQPRLYTPREEKLYTVFILSCYETHIIGAVISNVIALEANAIKAY